MPLFLISYDLKTANADNEAVRIHLSSLGAKHILKSVWLVKGQDEFSVTEAVTSVMRKGDSFVVALIDNQHIIKGTVPFDTATERVKRALKRLST
ncbi:hypothetical protein [Burkholderia gladioli]|uniref:hypothetical protein n=1 Tax=Burkholderia gladioli TaxID=28095 RepID=UPI0016406C4B|nr:hypothetical protein [Burkholderia gladioli]